MTATNICSNFGGFRCRPSLVSEQEESKSMLNKETRTVTKVGVT